MGPGSRSRAVAADHEGAKRLYAEEVLKALRGPGLTDGGGVFKRLRVRGRHRALQGAQTPVRKGR